METQVSALAQSPVFWTIISLYLALIFAVAVYFARRMKNSSSFFGSSKETPWWTAGISFFMTAFSASVFIGGASFTYRYGGLSIAVIFFTLPTFVLGYYVFSRRWHRTGCSTAIEFIERRFGSAAANFFVASGVPIRVLDNANRVYVTSVLMQVFLGIPIWVGALACTTIALVSAVAGGFLAVVATDVLQAIVLAIISIVIAAVALERVGGFQGLWEQLPQGYLSLNPDGSSYGLGFVLAMGLVGIFSWNGYWSLVQRYVSVKTEKDARLVSLTSGVSYYLLFPIFTLPPMIAVVLLPGLSTTAETEQSYLLLAQMILPVGMLAIFFFALLGASITALNSEFNVVSQVIVEDVLRPHFEKLVESHGLYLGRIVTLIMALACLGISLTIPYLGGSYHFLVTVMGMTTIPAFLPLLYGLIFPGTPGWGAISAFLFGTTTSVLLLFGFGLPLEWVIVGNFVVTLGTVVISGSLNSRADHPSVQAIFHNLRASNSSIVEPTSVDGIGDQVSPMLRVVGIALMALAPVTLLGLLAPGEGNHLTLWLAGLLAVVGGIMFIFSRKSSLPASTPSS